MTPTQRSLARLRKDGYLAAVVEHWVPMAAPHAPRCPQCRQAFGRQGFRRDLWGIGDILSSKPGAGNLLVQTTSGSHVASRVAKALAEPRLVTWLKASPDNRFAVWGWRPLSSGKGKRKRWELREIRVRIAADRGQLVAVSEGFGEVAA